MFNKIQLTLGAAVLAAALSFATGCSPQANHPNQLNRFDGAAFDSLVLAHGSLVSLRTSVIDQYPQLAPQFNKVAEAYRLAVIAYTAYRKTGATELTLAKSLRNLTEMLIALESELQADLHKPEIQDASASADTQEKFAPSEFLRTLEFAATIASIIPQTEEEARAAGTILAATRQALAEWRTVAKAPINVAWLAPVENI